MRLYWLHKGVSCLTCGVFSGRVLRVGYVQDTYLVGKIVLLIQDGNTGGFVFRAIEPN